MIRIIGVVLALLCCWFYTEGDFLIYEYSPDSEVILQRLVSVTLNILISTSICCYTAVILISIFLAILGSDLCSCYLSIIITPDILISLNLIVLNYKSNS